MKKGPSKNTLNNYLSCFVEIKKGLEQNPRVKLSKYAIKFKIGKQPITVLKSTGVIIKHGNGHKWVGPEPSFNMILNVLEIIRIYHAELKQRKREQGELFTPKKVKNHSKGTENPTFINTDFDKKAVEVWRKTYEKQVGESSNIPIKTFDRSTASEFIETLNEINQFKKVEQRKTNRAILKSILTTGVNIFINLFKRKK